LLCNKIIIIIYQYFLLWLYVLLWLISNCCAFDREARDSCRIRIGESKRAVHFICLIIFNARRSLAVSSFKRRISGYWSVQTIIVPVLLKEFEGLLQKYEFEIQVQTKTFIIEVLGLYFRDFFCFLQYSKAFVLSSAFVRSFDFTKYSAFSNSLRAVAISQHFAIALRSIYSRYF